MSEPRLQSELDVLTAIEQGVVVTQASLTKRIGISIGLINALLKRAIVMGYVKTRQAPYKRYVYYLTPKGFAQKSRLVADYLDYSLRFFRTARSEYAELVAAAGKAGMTRLVLVGSGELAEIAVLAAWSEDVTLLGVIDPNANEPRRYGLTVFRSLDEAQQFDAVVITDIKEPQQTYDAMRTTLPASRVLAPPLLKITPDRAELIAAQARLGEHAMKRWYVVNTQPQQEARADENLRHQGFYSWLPLFRRLRRHARRTDHVLVPLFPGYLFVQLDPEIERWRSINGTFGVVRLLCNGDTPLAVPDGMVEEIMRRRDGSGLVVLPPRQLTVGKLVRVAAGPFADLEGLFQEMLGRDRVVLLFNLLGRKVQTSVPLTELAA